MGEVVPLRPARSPRDRVSSHPAHDTLLTCDCGGRWFSAVVTFRSLPGGFWKPDAYTMVDDTNQPAVACTGCGKHFMLQ